MKLPEAVFRELKAGKVTLGELMRILDEAKLRPLIRYNQEGQVVAYIEYSPGVDRAAGWGTTWGEALANLIRLLVPADGGSDVSPD
jgi:hypothetical protein